MQTGPGFEINPVQAWICEGFLFATAKIVSTTAMIFSHLILHPAVFLCDLDNYTGFVPVFEQKIQGLFKDFKDTFPISQGCYSIQKEP